MSSGEQANQQPPALENFLIVAYRSLRGNKRVSAFGCPKDLLDASADKIEEMKQNAGFEKETLEKGIFSDFQLTVDEHTSSKTVSFLCFKKNSKSKRVRSDEVEIYQAGKQVPLERIVEEPIFRSFLYHQGGFSGLTVIIHDCYVVILANSSTPVLRYYKDEEGQIKCETTAIPVKPQASYYNGWVSYNRSFVHNRMKIAFITRQGEIASFDLTNPEIVTIKKPEPSNLLENPDDEDPQKYADLKLYCRKSFSLFAVTACGRIDYYQGAKRLVHSHTIDKTEFLNLHSRPTPVFTTIGCDDDFVALGYMLEAGPAIKNEVAVYQIMKRVDRPYRLRKIGSAQYSTVEAGISNKNPAHHLAFMYPKRYRILYAQQLFSLGCIFYVDWKRSQLIHLRTWKFVECSLL